MHIRSLKLIYFSPTQTTRKVLEGIAQGTKTGAVECIDLTLPDVRGGVFGALNDELAIIGTPVYAGRVPLAAVERFKRIRANRTPAVFVVTYGNRAFEDALLELRNLAEEARFVPVAAAAFIGEHSFSVDEIPLAAGRPDARDMDRAREFGKTVVRKLGSITRLNELSPLQVPGNYPHREPKKPSDVPLEATRRCASFAVCAPRFAPLGP